MPRRPRVPVVVLSGGLGSGKTTLLNHLLRASTARIGVVVNDFGDIDVDAMLVTGNVDATRTFSGGCLCCLSDPSQLDDALTALARPAADLDAIVIEASGLAEPRELARMVLAGRSVGTRFGGVVEVVDAATWATAEDGTFAPPPSRPTTSPSPRSSSSTRSTASRPTTPPASASPTP